MRTAEAANWKRHEDKLLYSLVSSALDDGKTPGEAYQFASEYFEHMPTLTNREPNAIRQRWGKIKNDESLKEEDAVVLLDPEVPVTTGFQQEMDFESGFLIDGQFRPERYEVQEERLFVPEIPRSEPALVKPSHIHDAVKQLTDFIEKLETSHMELEKENNDLKWEIAKLHQHVDELKKELETFHQVKAIMSRGA